MKTVCIFGDSIAVGLNASNNEGWAFHLKKFIEERDDTEVKNLAARGETTEKLLKHMEEECGKLNPSEIILAIGINDSLYSFTEHRPQVPREKFEENLAKVFSIGQKSASKIVVLGITRVDERHTVVSTAQGEVCQYQNITIQKFNDALKNVASLHGATFIDLFALLSDDDLDDGYHPNDSGHKKLFEAIKNHL